MKQKSIGLNAILNSIKSCLSIVVPLITFPYATRILGVNNIGKINYALSIVHYFALIAILGITTYAIREGSKVRDDKQEIQKFSSEIFSLNFFTTLVSYVLLFVFILISTKMKEYRLLILIQSLSIIFTTIGIDWINSIYEDYLFITIRTIIINFISILALFVFVKSPNDYYIYAILSVLTNAIIAVINYFYCKKYVKVKFTFSTNIFKHLKYTLIFFINSLSISIYVNSDMTMLGWICGDYFVGIYSVAAKVYNIVKTLLASIYTVAIPRLSYYVGKNDMVKFRELFTKIMMYLSLILLPCISGLIGLANEIVILLSGQDYIDSALTLKILSISLLFAIFGGAVTSCLNIPLKRELLNMKATIVSAITNIVLNIYFIPKFKQNGAAFTSAISELIVLLICIISLKKIYEYLNIKLFIKNFVHALLGMITVFVICSIYIHNIMLSILIKIIFSIVIYGIELILLKNQCVKDVFNYIIKLKQKGEKVL